MGAPGVFIGAMRQRVPVKDRSSASLGTKRCRPVLSAKGRAARSILTGSVGWRPPIIMSNDSRQRGQFAVVHVRRSAPGLAQARGLERVLHRRDVREETSASLIVVRQTDVMEAVVGEKPSAVARGAPCFGVEQREAAFGSIWNRCFIPRRSTRRRAQRQNDRAFIGCDRVGDQFRRDCLVWKCRRETGTRIRLFRTGC